MNKTDPQFTTTLSLPEMEALIRRVVKEAVHEEFVRLRQNLAGSVAENWAHEGADDPAGDELLLAEALDERQRYRTHRGEFTEWETLKAALKAAEAAGDLPD